MKYAMLATLIPKESEDDFFKNSRHNMQDAASVLQWNLYRGLCDNLGVNFPLFNVLPVGSFPQYYKYPYIKRSKFDLNGIGIGFCNVKLLRNYAKSRKIYQELKKWCKSCSEPKMLFVYTLSLPFMEASVKLKEEFSDLQICAIVADLPQMSSLSSKRSLWARMFSMLSANRVDKLIPYVDSFVLLTKHMADYLKLTQPYCVMEGIASDPELPQEQYVDETETKTIMYSGTLHRKFGVLHLVDAFEQISFPNYRLVICGAGDSEVEIRDAAKRDARISFLGQLKREEVLKLQMRATVLVNPRLNNEEFTKYSFPSKTMEYLASGVPVIAYKLDGIPDEYDEFLNYPMDDSIESLANILMHICEKEMDDRFEMGAAGRAFVIDNRNRLAQTNAIVRLVKQIQQQKNGYVNEE